MTDQSLEFTPARTVIADCAELVRRGIRDVLTRDRRFHVIREVEHPDDLVEACLEAAPDIVLLGVCAENDLPRQTSAVFAALRRISQIDPLTRSVVLLESESVDDLLEAVRSGARAVLLRDAPATVMLAACHDVLAGHAAIDPSLARSLFEHLSLTTGSAFGEAPEHGLNPATMAALSPREQDVLRALARGYRNKEIAAELGVSVGTVKTHLRHIFRKIRVSDRTAAVLAALNSRRPKAA